jgi:hypothetical protein
MLQPIETVVEKFVVHDFQMGRAVVAATGWKREEMWWWCSPLN